MTERDGFAIIWYILVLGFSISIGMLFNNGAAGAVTFFGMMLMYAIVSKMLRDIDES